MKTKKSELTTINVYAGMSSNGKIVYEELLAAPGLPSEYCLLSSPGLALGLARGDVISLDETSGRYRLLRRGGNICVQVYTNIAMSSEADDFVKKVVSQLGGSLDGRTPKQLVFSINSKVGFNAIEEVFNGFSRENSEVEWFYANVYDENDGVTPLNWWLD